MNLLGDFHFIRPAWLLLVLIAISLWWLRQKSQDPLRGWRAVMDADLLAATTVGEDAGGRWRGAALLVGWVLAVTAIAGPTWRPEPSPFADNPVPAMLVLKAGETMSVSDLAPSRMERARLKIADFATERRGQPLGLIVYAGSAHLVLPPTRDTSVVATMAAEIDPTIMPKPGDNLVGALELALQTLGDAGGSVVAVVDSVPSASVAALREFRNKSRLPVHFLAVARADTPELEAIESAASSLGASVALIAPDSSDVATLVRRTASAPVAVTGTGEGTRWTEAGWWMVPVIALLVLTSFRRERLSLPEEAVR